MNKRIIQLGENNKVVAFRFGKTPGENQMFSELGDMGQILQEDGTFSTPVIESEKEGYVNVEVLKKELIDEMQLQIARKDDVKWQTARDAYDKL